jgi:hypothetical protein
MFQELAGRKPWVQEVAKLCLPGRSRPTTCIASLHILRVSRRIKRLAIARLRRGSPLKRAVEPP